MSQRSRGFVLNVSWFFQPHRSRASIQLPCLQFNTIASGKERCRAGFCFYVCVACIDRVVADTIFFEVASLIVLFFIHGGRIRELGKNVQGHPARQAWIPIQFYLTLRTKLLIMAKTLPLYYLTLSWNPVYLCVHVFHCCLLPRASQKQFMKHIRRNAYIQSHGCMCTLILMIQ